MLLRLDFSSQVPIYRQIRDQIVVGIASGELRPGEKLPAIRALAEQSGVNMMTVSKAYSLLKQEGRPRPPARQAYSLLPPAALITPDRRGGTVVAGSPETGELGPQSREGLRLIAAEARLSGVSEESFLGLCRDFYREGGGEK